MQKSICAGVMLGLFMGIKAYALPSILPYPKSITMQGDTLFLPASISFRIAAAEALQDFRFLKLLLLKEGSFTFRQIPPDLRAEEFITYRRADKDMQHRDEYKLVIGNTISITAREDGFFHALQTIRQLLVRDAKGRIGLLKVSIRDYPEFSWRGMHLDVARHFFSVDEVFRFIDLLALHKMNRFHWHLTDDQGWRIPIKRYPLLTGPGAARPRSMVGHYIEQRWDTIPYIHHYTEEEIKAIVNYAAERHIVVIPEIEMPGHVRAALAAYPEFSCTRKEMETADTWGVFEDVMCTRKESIEFMKNILTEVAALFPGDYIHIGGDECPVTRWKECSSCAATMRENKLNAVDELEHYFLGEIFKHLKSLNKKMIGWDEIIDGKPVGDAAVMSWRGTAGGIKAAQLRREVVMSPGRPCYFDHYQGNPELEAVAIGGRNTIEHVYDYNPIPAELSASEAAYILGAQGNLWSEYIPDFITLQKRALPRMCALSEVLWGKNAEASDFYSIRLPTFIKLLEKYGYTVSSTWWVPEVRNENRVLSFSHRLAQGSQNVKILVNGQERSSYPIEKNERITVELAGHTGPRTIRSFELMGSAPDSIQILSTTGKAAERYRSLTDGIVSPAVFPDTRDYGIYTRADSVHLQVYGLSSEKLNLHFAKLGDSLQSVPSIGITLEDGTLIPAAASANAGLNSSEQVIQLSNLPIKGTEGLRLTILNPGKHVYYLTEVSY